MTSAATPPIPPPFVVKQFSSSIAAKLDDANFLPWKHLALSFINGQDLQDHLLADKVPQRFASDADRDAGKESQAFKNWRQQDYALVAWLLSSMEPAFTNRMVGCEFAHQVWNRVQIYFASLTKAKIKQLRTQLKNTKKLGLSISEYMLGIKKSVDSLAAVGSPLSAEEQIDAILDGLGEEYASLITTVLSRETPFSVPALEALLMAHEEMLDLFKKIDSPLVQANSAQSDFQDSKPPNRGTNSGRGRGSSNNTRGGRSSRGRNSWNSGSRPQCQLCGRQGHPVNECFYRFDQSFQPPSRPPPPNFRGNTNPPPPSSSFHNPRAYIATPSSVVDPAWYIDSGASHHLTSEKANLLTSSDYGGPEQVYIGNGQGHQGTSPTRTA